MMLVPIIPIGNSRGIRIPGSILKQCHIEDTVELTIHDDELLIRPVHTGARETWAEGFRQMAERGEDRMLIDEAVDPALDWEW